MISARRILETTRQRMLYRNMVYACLLLCCVVMAIALDDGPPEWKAMVGSAVIGTAFAFLNRPLVSHAREVDDLFYLQSGSEGPGWLSILNGIGVVALLVSILFVEAAYLNCAGFSLAFASTILILQFEGSYGELRLGEPEN
ncbi:MAG: hypothetical protein PVI67_04250 [Anaerolineae bacterium]